MAIYVLENRATVVEFVPPERPSTATCSWKDPGGAEISAPTATVDSASGSVSVVTDQDQFTVASVTPVVARQYWMVSGETAKPEALVRCARFNSTTMYLEGPPPFTVAASDTIRGARITVTVPSTATRALRYRLEFTITGADSIVRTYQVEVHVCRVLFRAACTADDAKRYVDNAFPSFSAGRPFGYFYELGLRSSRRVERKLLAGEKFQHLYGDHDLFADAGLGALRIELAHEGLVPPTFSPDDYIAKQEVALEKSIAEAIAGRWYDADDDGSEAETEVRGIHSISMVRR